jgi:DNA-directed RNA polymerase beta' subunit
LDEQIELAGLHKLKGDRKFTKILEKLEKTDICAHCSAPQPKIVYKSKDATIAMEYKQKKGDGNAKIGILLTVEDIKRIFDGISDKDVETLGLDPSLTHPKNFILTALPVIPPCSRPFVMADGNTCDDDLTYQYNEIIKINNQLATPESIKVKKAEKKEDAIQRLSQSLKFRIATLINNSKGRAKHPTDSRPLKCLKQRLVGKGGRIRFNLMGDEISGVNL